jgi:hypothetical protein
MQQLTPSTAITTATAIRTVNVLIAQQADIEGASLPQQ